MKPLETTAIRALDGNLAGIDMTLARRVEDLWLEHGGNRMSWAYLDDRNELGISDFNASPRYNTTDNEFQFGATGGAETPKFALPWEIAVGFSQLEAEIVLARPQNKNLAPPQIRMTTAVLIDAVATQSGNFADITDGSSAAQSSYFARALRPYWLHNSPSGGVDREEFIISAAVCGVELASFAADRRMLVSFDLSADAEMIIVSLFLRDKPPVRS